MKKLEEEIKDKAEMYSKSRRFGVWVDDAIETFTKGYNACLQDNRWRKVSEELPSHDQIVLVRTDDGCYHTAEYDTNMDEFLSITMFELDECRYLRIPHIVEWKPII